MSGGELDGCRYVYISLLDVNERDDDIAELINDLCIYLKEEDYYLSGDCDENRWQKARKSFRSKYIDRK